MIELLSGAMAPRRGGLFKDGPSAYTEGRVLANESYFRLWSDFSWRAGDAIVKTRIYNLNVNP